MPCYPGPSTQFLLPKQAVELADLLSTISPSISSSFSSFSSFSSS